MLVSLTWPVTPESNWVPSRLPKPTRHLITFLFPHKYCSMGIGFCPSPCRQVLLYSYSFFSFPIYTNTAHSVSESETFVFRRFRGLVHDKSIFLRCPTLSKGRVRSAHNEASVEEEEEEGEEEEEDVEGSATLVGGFAEGGPVATSTSSFCCTSFVVFLLFAQSKRAQHPALRVRHKGWQGERHRDALHQSASSCRTTTRWRYTRCSASAGSCTDCVQKPWPSRPNEHWWAQGNNLSM